MTTLEKIRAEIRKYLEDECINEKEAEGIMFCLEIIDKYAEQSGWEEMTVPCENCGHDMTFKIAVCGEPTDEWQNGYDMAWEEAKVFYEKEPCEDAVSRQAVLDKLNEWEWQELYLPIHFKENIIDELPSVQPKAKTGRCKECQYFEHDSVANVDGVPLIVAHEICSKWGDGCKTNEDGYCFMFEQKGGMSQEVKEHYEKLGAYYNTKGENK